MFFWLKGEFFLSKDLLVWLFGRAQETSVKVFSSFVSLLLVFLLGNFLWLSYELGRLLKEKEAVGKKKLPLMD